MKEAWREREVRVEPEWTGFRTGTEPVRIREVLIVCFVERVVTAFEEFKFNIGRTLLFMQVL